MDKLKIPFLRVGDGLAALGIVVAMIPPGLVGLFSRRICQERKVSFLIAAGGNGTVDGLINMLVAATISLSDLKKFMKSLINRICDIFPGDSPNLYQLKALPSLLPYGKKQGCCFPLPSIPVALSAVISGFWPMWNLPAEPLSRPTVQTPAA